MSLAVENQFYNQQMANPAGHSTQGLPNPNSNIYGDINIAQNARVHLGDVVQYIQSSHDPNVGALPSQDLLDSFIHENIDLVERFDQRIHFLKHSIDSDNAAKSQALRNIGDEIRNLEYWMMQNKTKLERARQSKDTYTAETTDAYVRILMAMNQTLHSVLDALASSLEIQCRTEAERLEKEQMLKEIEHSQQNISNSVDTACDSIQAAGKVMQVIPGAQRPEMQRAGKIMDDSAFGVRMFKKFAAFANKGRDDENQSSRGNFPPRHPYRSSVSSRPARQDGNRDHTDTNNLPCYIPRQSVPSFLVSESDEPSQRPSLPPRRPGQPCSATSKIPDGETRLGFDEDATIQNPKDTTPQASRLSASAPRSRVLGNSNGWELQRLPPPPRRITQVSRYSPKRLVPTETGSQSHENSISRVASAPPSPPTQEAAAPPLPIRAPKLPPRPSAPSRVVLSDPGPILEVQSTKFTQLATNSDAMITACSNNTGIRSRILAVNEVELQSPAHGALRTSRTVSTGPATPKPREEVSQAQSPSSSATANVTNVDSPPLVKKPAIPCKPKRLSSSPPTVTNSSQTTTRQSLGSGEHKFTSMTDSPPVSDKNEATLTFAQKQAMFAGAGRQIRVACVELK